MIDAVPCLHTAASQACASLKQADHSFSVKVGDGTIIFQVKLACINLSLPRKSKMLRCSSNII